MSVVFEFGAHREHVAATFHDGPFRQRVLRKADAARVLVQDGVDFRGQPGVLDLAEESFWFTKRIASCISGSGFALQTIQNFSVPGCLRRTRTSPIAPLPMPCALDGIG